VPNARDLLRRHRRALLVFVIAFVVLCGFAGTNKLFRPSANNHFVHLADGWTHGRLAVDGDPPGYCSKERRRAHECRRHGHDDWAVLHTLELEDGSELRGYPCQTTDCDTIRREERLDPWYVPGEGWVKLERRSYEKVGRTWYVSFPPGPAVLMWPFVAIWGLGFWDVLFTCFCGALIPAVMLSMLDRVRGVEDGHGRVHLWAVAAWTLASPALFLAPNASVWFTAQIVGALMLVIYVSCAWDLERPAIAGLALGLATASRPFMLFAVVLFGLEWHRAGRPREAAIRFIAPLAAIGIALAAHNYVRFADPFEFGHRFLDIRWQARMQEVGMFSTDYLARNLRCMLTLLPASHSEFPFFKVSIHGSALWLGAPWLAALVVSRTRFAQRAALLAAVFAIAIPALLYQNSGQLQYTYRFAADWLPLMLLVVVFGGGARRKWFPALVIAGALFQGWGAYHLQRKRGPAKIFVADPLGWPFEHELDERR
jgi:hypothetical protein